MTQDTDKKAEDVKIPSRDELLAEGGEQKKEEQKASEPSYTATELKAIEQGWKPLDQWDGDPEQHRSAREYLDRGELLGKIKSQSAQLGEIKQALTSLTEHNKKVFTAGYEKAIQELRAAKKAALEAGDLSSVMEIDDKIDENKEELRKVKSQATQATAAPSATTVQWLSENEWYAKDEAMHLLTDAIAVKFARANPTATEEAIYAHIDKEIRKAMPDRFQKKSAIDPDTSGRHGVPPKGPKGGAGGFEKLLESMDEDQARIARTLVKTGAITKEKYVEDYNAMFGSR